MADQLVFCDGDEANNQVPKGPTPGIEPCHVWLDRFTFALQLTRGVVLAR